MPYYTELFKIIFGLCCQKCQNRKGEIIQIIYGRNTVLFKMVMSHLGIHIISCAMNVIAATDDENLQKRRESTFKMWNYLDHYHRALDLSKSFAELSTIQIVDQSKLQDMEREIVYISDNCIFSVPLFIRVAEVVYNNPELLQKTIDNLLNYRKIRAKMTQEGWDSDDDSSDSLLYTLCKREIHFDIVKIVCDSLGEADKPSPEDFKGCFDMVLRELKKMKIAEKVNAFYTKDPEREENLVRIKWFLEQRL